MADRIRVRVLRPYGVNVDGELVERARGELVEESRALAGMLIAANKAELVDPPPAYLEAAEFEKLAREKLERAEAAEAAAQAGMLIAANKAELVDPPPACLEPAEAEKLAREKVERAEAAEAAAQAAGIEAATAPAPERAARAGRTAR